MEHERGGFRHFRNLAASVIGHLGCPGIERGDIMASQYTNLERQAPYVLSILRIMAALLFLQHGLQKYVGFPAPSPPTMTTLFYIQGVIEIAGGILLLLGAWTRIVAFILSGDMAVAFFIAHVPRGSIFPLANGGDAAVLYCFVFLYIFFAGGGPWSADRAILKGA
jgi:putative oxidoreductase